MLSEQADGRVASSIQGLELHAAELLQAACPLATYGNCGFRVLRPQAACCPGATHRALSQSTL